jgi:2-polyprenyl-6-methoxyphenol hydroxylase-like FAD-dependent oxidoreductase
MNTHLKENFCDHLIIIGSGPVGMVAALILKDHFNRITLLERQSKGNFLKRYGFTFPIVFSPSSINILKKVGAWKAIEAERSEFFGVVVHKRILGKEFEAKSYEENVYSHWRNHIIVSLYERILEENIEVHFDARVEDIDFENSVFSEAALGDLPFDLLIGADGINSRTRKLLAKAHPDYSEEDFGLTLLDKWYAYRLPAKDKLKEKWGGGDRFYASNVYVDNLPKYPSEKFRVVTTSMKQPEEEISVLVKHGANLELDRVRELNQVFFEDYVDSPQELETAWEGGYGGKFEQVTAPTFTYQKVLLLGDSAHGFESTGDLINLGLASIVSFYKIFKKDQSIEKALEEYDETIGESLRYYAQFSLRRSKEKIGFEIASIEFGARLGITNRHPSLFGIFVDDFEIHNYMESYKGDILKGKLLIFGLMFILVILAGWLLLI